MLNRIDVGKNLRERVPYSDITFPFNVWLDIFNDFINHTVNCHWHYDFEYGCVLSGTVDYYINNTHIKLRKGDCFFVNSNVLHMGKQPDSCSDAVMFTITFPVTLLTSNISDTIYAKYFQSVMNGRIDGFHVESGDLRGQDIKKLLTDLYNSKPTDFCYELKCMNRVSRLWIETLRYIGNDDDGFVLRTGSTHHAERIKEILSYIHEHYEGKITVDDLAKYANISRAECFRCFSRFMNKSPVEYINEYRMSVAAKLLKESEMSVTDIYSKCGFENASYFVKVFKGKYGVTPLRYRKGDTVIAEQRQRCNRI